MGCGPCMGKKQFKGRGEAVGTDRYDGRARSIKKPPKMTEEEKEEQRRARLEAAEKRKIDQQSLGLSKEEAIELKMKHKRKENDLKDGNDFNHMQWKA